MAGARSWFKKTQQGLAFSTHFSLFGNQGETLFLVFDILYASNIMKTHVELHAR